MLLSVTCVPRGVFGTLIRTDGATLLTWTDTLLEKLLPSGRTR